jgi:quercetin dioxygenase-like cupin family protein
MKTRLTALFLFMLGCFGPGHAATVEAVNGGASARTRQSLTAGSTFATKKASQSQLRLNKGFVRLGSSSQVQLGKSDQVQLKEGVMMVGSDGAKKRESVKVTAPGYSFNVQGTALIAYHPGSYIKITVLEGSIRVSLQSMLGEFVTLKAGQMLVINPAEKRLPDLVEVDLNRLITTSKLVGGPLGPPPTNPFIQSSAGDQNGDLSGGFIARTPFAMRGASPEVTVFQLVNDLEDPNTTVSEKDYSPASANEINALADKTITRSGAKTRTLNVQMRSGGPGFDISLSGVIKAVKDVFGGVTQKLAFHGDDTLSVMPGADISTPKGTALEFNAKALDIDGATLTSGSATLPSESLSLIAWGNDGTREFDVGVKNNSRLNSGSFSIMGSAGANPQRVGIDNSHITAPLGILIGQERDATPISITIRNSSELAALAGSIKFDSGGQPILVDSSILRANPATGQIVLDAGENGDTLTLRNSTLSADVIKARGHSASGDAVIVDGGSYLAGTMLKFYATGASMLRFRGNVTIDSPLSVFSGSTVQVDAGGSVRSTGTVNVYTNQANFNTAGFGTITTRTNEVPAGVAPTVLPFNSPTKPAF